LGNEESVEIVARSGFDFLVIDLEHSQLTLDAAYRLLATACLVGVPVFVRNPEFHRVAYQRLLDAGADGILAPMLESLDAVNEGISLCLYPPGGVRGFSTTTRAGKWGASPRAEHIANANARVTFIPQLESRVALDALNEIVQADGLDAVFIGMADLAVSMNLAPDDEVVRGLVDEAAATCRHHKLLIGTSVPVIDGADLTRYQLFDFLMIGDDASLLSFSARRLVSTARSLLGVQS
jgi:2-keto-3-deoxy-L-rhamnonate aldolase RhmA